MMCNSRELDLKDYGTLVGLVERYSPTGNEGEAVQWLVNRMASTGFSQASMDEAGNAVGVMGDGPRQLVLLGHIDTVPGEIPVKVEGDLLFGRGTVDAKGSLAAFVDAVARLGPVDGWRIVVIGAVEEEGDSTGARFVASQYQPDYAIVGEPSQWDRITLGYKGSAWAEVSVQRQVSHSAGQDQSACEVGVEVWNRISAWAQARNADKPRVFDQVSPSLRGWSSGSDGFEEWAKLEVGVRLPPELSPQTWYERVKQLVGEANVEQVGYPIHAYQAEKNTPLVRAFLAAIRGSGGKPRFLFKTGTADLNIVAPAWGCPAVAYGPGDSSLDHTPEEHISLSEYGRAVEVLQATLSQLTQYH
jgi:LysW-gamma-L-lysine carboxypeptidase